jgi:hypothetical protein
MAMTVEKHPPIVKECISKKGVLLLKNFNPITSI